MKWKCQVCGGFLFKLLFKVITLFIYLVLVLMFATWGGIISAKRTNGLVGKKKNEPKWKKSTLAKTLVLQDAKDTTINHISWFLHYEKIF